MKKYKYIVYPTYVLSKDNEMHYIDFHKLCRLYKVNPKDCINAGSHNKLKGMRKEFIDKLIPLYPSESGNYNLKKRDYKNSINNYK